MGLLTEISSDGKKPVIDPPGKPHGVVAEASGASQAGAASKPPSPSSPPPLEKFSCSHVRRKKILLVGSDASGELNWGDVTPAQQCIGCEAIFIDTPPNSILQ